MIASNKKMCEGHRLRLQWVERLWGQVDMYGRGFNEIALKEEGLCDYMFSIAIENGQYGTYFTEKLLDCFATGTIPVYLGAPDIGNYFNKDGIILFTEPEELIDILSYTDVNYYNDRIEVIKENFIKAEPFLYPWKYIKENYLNEI